MVSRPTSETRVTVAIAALRVGHDISRDGVQLTGKWPHLYISGLLIHHRFDHAGLVHACRLAVESGQISAFLVRPSQGAHQVRSRVETRDAVHAAIVGLRLRHHPRRTRIAHRYYFMLRQADIVFVHDDAGNGRKARQANTQKSGLVLIQDHGLAGRAPAFLPVLRWHETAPRSGDEVRARRQVDEFEHTVSVGANAPARAWAAGHWLDRNQGARQRLPGLVLYDGALDDGGLKRAAREQVHQPFAHRF